MLGFTDRDRFARPQIVPENFSEQLPAAADFWREPLTDDVTKGVREANPELLFFAEREEAEDTIDGLPGINCMESAQDEVPGFGRHQGDFDGRPVAHLADQN